MNDTPQATTRSLLDGRMRRRPYAWIAPLVFSIPLLFAWAILYTTNWRDSKFEWGFPLGIVVFVVTILSQLVGTGIVVVRRANDCGKDRSLAALLLIPVVNIIVIVYLMFPQSVGAEAKVRLQQQQPEGGQDGNE